MDTKTKHRIADRLGLTALPRGYAKPQTVKRVQSEVDETERMIAEAHASKPKRKGDA